MLTRCLKGTSLVRNYGHQPAQLRVGILSSHQNRAARFSTSALLAIYKQQDQRQHSAQKQRYLRRKQQQNLAREQPRKQLFNDLQSQPWEGSGQDEVEVESLISEEGESAAPEPTLASLQHSVSTKGASTNHQSELEGFQQDVTFRHIPRSLLEHWQDIPAPEPQQRAFANNFFRKHKPRLLFTAGSLHQVDMTDVPEVAFLGRSNVGKSTLLNALLDHKVARVSAKPGKTTTLNAWATGGADRTGKRWRLTVLDMPGYGGGSRQEWGTLIQKYLAQRKELRRAFVLVHAEHGLLENDRVILQMLRQASIPHQVVLSKVDQLFLKSGSKVKRGKKQGRSEHMISAGKLSAFSNLISEQVESIREEGKGDRAQRELPLVPDIIAVSGDNAQALPMQASECRITSGARGIGALRWAILHSVGITGDLRFKDEKDMTF